MQVSNGAERARNKRTGYVTKTGVRKTLPKTSAKTGMVAIKNFFQKPRLDFFFWNRLDPAPSLTCFKSFTSLRRYVTGIKRFFNSEFQRDFPQMTACTTIAMHAGDARIVVLSQAKRLNYQQAKNGTITLVQNAFNAIAKYRSGRTRLEAAAVARFMKRARI